MLAVMPTPFAPEDAVEVEWGETHPITDPVDIPVQLNVRVPWHYREQLQKLAIEKKTSFNRLIVNALVRVYPPERR